jgi:hypothetical protein
MYDGVKTFGVVHSMRMQDVFWGRQRILLRVLEVLLAAMPPPASQNRADLMSRSWRELIETIYPNNRDARDKQEAWMKQLIQRLGKQNLELFPME